MISVLINAYACSPDMGSEPGMGWNWCVNLAKYCDLHIITEGEFRDKIEATLPNLPQRRNMHFYYNPVSDKIRQMCWNQGDYRFYYFYKKWQKETYKMALDIVKNNQIDIIHQLNMIGFREPGYLWKIKGIPFFWGPIGGLEQFPLSYLKGAGVKMSLFFRIKNIISGLQLKFGIRVNKALKRATCLIVSTKGSLASVKKHIKKEMVVIPETGTYLKESSFKKAPDDSEFHVIWVGKFDFRKQLLLSVKTLFLTHNKNIVLDVFGRGTEIQEQEAKELCKALKIPEQIIWHGNQPHKVVFEAMRKAQLFFFTSVNEATSTVVMEAVSHNLPVLCFDACGQGGVVNEKVGLKIPLSEPEESAEKFADKLNYLYENKDVLNKFSENCKQRQRELSWDNKAKQMLDLYHKYLVNNEKECYLQVKSFFGSKYR